MWKSFSGQVVTTPHQQPGVCCKRSQAVQSCTEAAWRSSPGGDRPPPHLCTRSIHYPATLVGQLLTCCQAVGQLVATNLPARNLAAWKTVPSSKVTRQESYWCACKEKGPSQAPVQRLLLLLWPPLERPALVTLRPAWPALPPQLTGGAGFIGSHVAAALVQRYVSYKASQGIGRTITPRTVFDRCGRRAGTLAPPRPTHLVSGCLSQAMNASMRTSCRIYVVRACALVLEPSAGAGCGACGRSTHRRPTAIPPQPGHACQLQVVVLDRLDPCASTKNLEAAQAAAPGRLKLVRGDILAADLLQVGSCRAKVRAHSPTVAVT